MFTKRLLLILSLCVFGALPAQLNPITDPDDPGFSESCTSIMVGKAASTDGSVITTQSCDQNYRTWLRFEPSKTYQPGDMEPVYWGMLHNEEPHDMRNVEVKGYIPAPAKTYAFMNVAYPCMNEVQLAIGETTTVGKRELVNREGLFLIEELQRIALQRCSTAREAVQLIGRLAQQYGYGDVGECLSIADPHEVWHLEIYGSGPGKPSALWVAQRIPDDHVGVSANVPRIGKVDFNDPKNFMYSSDLKERSQQLGYWDGKEPYVFWKVVSAGTKAYAIREFFILNALAPSLNLNMDGDELPFSVKPDKKVSVQDIIAFYRQTYEGSPYDQMQNLKVTQTVRDSEGNEVTETITSPATSNFMSNDMRNLLNALKPGVVERQRTIAIVACSYSQVIQLRSWLPNEIGGVAYFSFDNPAQSPRFPIYAGTTSLPKSFDVCGQHRYRTDAAIWSFREANRIATVNWARTRGIMEPEQMRLEEKLFSETPALEAKALSLIQEGKTGEAKQLLTSYTHDFAAMCMLKWEDMKATFWGMFARGF
ncbi:MAG: C69 family dipeptidase [Bacteroidales bacterium]|nr:C69 family dipeptidase [Bacteroidales bacterium]MCL2738790.1 C69 family dipeptidase [Bacteroidales bacterium]